ncbi:MAG: hypothetical protein GY854_21860 [Deltaproteobacteria bacterium]|nr:hypothetical protein [Deltaproteobacteria bacterium]
MAEKLNADELVALVQRVFTPGEGDRGLAIIVDMPDVEAADVAAWKERRDMAADWAGLLSERKSEIGMERVNLLLYRNARANNADLPATGAYCSDGTLPDDADEMRGGAVSFDQVFESHEILIAPTQFSATAPLKMAARQYGFRAATMPGFDRSMIPALRLDYGVIGKRVDRLKAILDDAEQCDIRFDADGEECALTLDLRYRDAHASGGVFPDGGVAGNLPSGESYIVPYEGEIEGDPSRSTGEIPVQLGDDVVVYRIEENRAVEVISRNATSADESHRLELEPAYGNLAELGLGVLGDFGLSPTGEILLDEKLGLHIAFGRSEHFGGQVGPDAFSSPDKVVHIDRVYIPKIQPKITIIEAMLKTSSGDDLLLMRDGQYQIDFD